MSLRDEIIPFVDGNNLVAPGPVNPGEIRASDNGVMFTSEYYIMLFKRQEDREYDVVEWESNIYRCALDRGLISRAPGDRGQQPPDDQYAILAAAKVLDAPRIAKDILNWGLKHYGSFNNENPDRWTTKSFLWRQPQLLAAAISAAGKASIFKFWLWPLYFLTALIIATSCIGVDKQHTDERRLSWLLIQTVTPDSLLCRLASKLWYKRLYKDYGPEGMKAVASIYYTGEHPFKKHWVD